MEAPARTHGWRSLCGRRERLAEAMAACGLDALVLVGSGLLKHHGYAEWVLGPLAPTRPVYAVLDAQASVTAFVVAEGDAVTLDAGVAAEVVADPPAAVATVLRARGAARVGIVGRDTLLPVGAWLALREGLPDATLDDATALADEVRAIKREDELHALRDAARIAQAAHGRIAGGVGPGAELADLLAAAHGEARRLGAREALIFAGDGLFHGTGLAGPPVDHGSLVTIYAEVLGPDGFWAEEVGMVAVGALDDPRERLAARAVAALTAAEGAMRPGARTADVAAAVQDAAGAEVGLCHSLGHGVGAGDGDLPRIASADGGTLAEGMALVLHPNVADRTAGVSATAGGTYAVEAGGAARLARVPALTRIAA